MIMQTVKVRAAQIGPQYVQGCLVNVEEVVAYHGGEAVLGWEVNRKEFFVELRHHVVWRTPLTTAGSGRLFKAGELVEITPALDPDSGFAAVVLRDIEFLPDPSAKFLGEKPNRRSLGNRYVPVEDHPFLVRACKSLDDGTELHNQGRFAESDELTTRANYWVNRYLRAKHMPGSYHIGNLARLQTVAA